jgi:penicillin G amidase
MPTDGSLPPKHRLAMLARVVRGLLQSPQPTTFPALTAANLPSMRGRVELLRDARGVPHIYAEDEADLYAALGYLQGADRFVLLDVLRHLGAGRMCELVGNFRAPKGGAMFAGKNVRDLDLFLRPLGFAAQCERDVERLSERGRACLQAYADGINAALDAMQGTYPPEYLLLGSVRRWSAGDTLLAARTCSLSVALAPLDVELAFDAVRGQIGDDAARRFFPEAPWENAPRTYANVAGSEPEIPLHLAASGSNNWAVSAARSASGAPLFANDPHVPFLLPTFWYHAHLECPRYRIQGGLMLGCPIFGFGHNGHAAWGVTTAYRDAWDLYRIHRLPGDPTRYRTVEGEGAITHHREDHRGRLRRSEPLEWESCEHGILYPGWKHHDGVDLALRLASFDMASYFDGYLDLAEAQTPAQHQAALARINEGPFDFNHVWAHKDGHIAWEPFGKLPRRQGDGLFVRDADDPAAQWQGFLPFSENPKIVNPERGWVASANSICEPETQHRSTTRTHVEPLHRQKRIEAALAASSAHSVASFQALQRDIGSDYGPALRDALLALIGPLEGSSLAARARRVLERWDGGFDIGSAGAPIYAFTLRELAPRTLLPLLGGDAGHRFLATRRGLPRVQRLLLEPTDPLRADVERAARKPLTDLVREAFETAARGLAKEYGEEPEMWRWGEVQRLRLATILGEIPFLGRRFRALEAPFPGDVYTVSASVAAPIGARPRPFVGATSRFICDLAKPDEGWFAHSSGPSADPSSTFFAGATEGWYRFEYFRSALWPAAEVPDVVERVVVG